MNKNKPKNIAINICVSVIFIIGLYIGTAISPLEKNALFNLSANAAMTPDTTGGKLFDDFSKVLSDTLPFEIKQNGQPEPDINKTPAPDYSANAPVLAGSSGNGVKIKNDTDYEIDINALMAQPLVKKSDKIKVLILHTHTSEAYTPSENYPYDMTDSYRSNDESRNVVAVGDVIEKVLKENGVEVIHDKTSHDYPSYTGSYKRALETIEKNLKTDPDITMILDIHRDAIADEQGQYMKTVAKIDGVTCAQALLVVGTDFGGLEHPNWRDNLKYALRLQKIMCEKYPSLARDIHLRKERFNGHAGEGAMIIEVGSNGNTLDEALKCAEYVGDSIVKLIDEN